MLIWAPVLIDISLPEFCPKAIYCQSVIGSFYPFLQILEVPAGYKFIISSPCLNCYVANDLEIVAI
ncbi:hypothetical protein OMCYN_01635 [cyanobiont of Ornithocercus magnificus]|nr:hypothetical protein OMCYN_01635 [cyanobiont of Ornithocercus magnificus]